MSPQGERISSKAKQAKAVLVALICAAALLAVPAGAGAADASTSGAGMNLEFARDTVRTVGPGALVFVKCAGSQDGICTGTVTLSVGGAKHKVPFSVFGGSTQTLIVPLGSDSTGRGQTAVATASTAQPLGFYAQCTEVLHFK